MLRKIALLAILTTLFITANLFAVDELPGCKITVRSGDFETYYEPIVDLLVVWIFEGQSDYDVTDVDGKVCFAVKGDSGYYYLCTIWNGKNYGKYFTKIEDIQLFTDWVLVPNNNQ